jgi:SpoVK/Ycf46/Vps4 family AAA+-type ATPase
MNSVVNSPETNWHEANWQCLLKAIAQVRQALEQHCTDSVATTQVQAQPATRKTSQPSALEKLCTTFELSIFEQEILLLCVGIELDPSLALLCASFHKDKQRNHPTFHLAMTVLSQPHWSAFTPDRPLRRWRLIELGAGQTLSLSPLRVDERILHYLVGVEYLDERLKNLMKPLADESNLVPSHQLLAEKLAGFWQPEMESMIQLCGMEKVSKQAIASVASQLAGYRLYRLSAPSLPTAAPDLTSLLLLWERESMLSRYALLFDCEGLDSAHAPEGSIAALYAAIAQWIDEVNSPLILSSRDRWQHSGTRTLITFEVQSPTRAEQRSLWQKHLSPTLSPSESINSEVESLISQFNLNTPTIQTIAIEFSSQSAEPATPLWDLCRAQTRPRLEDLAQRIEPAAAWDDLVLPEQEKQVLRTIAAHVHRRTMVYERWGFASRGDRGLGISALFAGASGTGKTMSAEVLAQELRLDLYRIDLSSIVSKYIGETEKNLRKVFDAAESGAAILLFDEADALFGKRSEVKDSHDRYANMEVSYLLQRMEAYQGLAVLTSNLKDSLDTAFLRRIRFVVKYPFPDVPQRKEIWQRVFPKQTPTEGLEWDRLARLNVAGGNIRNIALNAAFIAAEADGSVQMKHLLEAARSEYIKLERTLTEAEVKGWV